MATVGLVSCVSRKRSHATKASELYDSPLFQKARQFVEQRCDRWYILSAKYGLVDPEHVIALYEETLNTKSAAECIQWGQRVWADLCHHLNPGDHVVFLAGERYRKHLFPELVRHGCKVEVPMEGLGIGRQLQWLSQQLAPSARQKDLGRLYGALDALEQGVGGKRVLSICCGRDSWPPNGVYFFFEPGEYRNDATQPRIVRVGTHGVSRGSKATLWNRLRTHRGTHDQCGNHRSSIFRLHVGAALGARNPTLAVASWGIGQSASAETTKAEIELEREVSRHIGAMSILWLAVEDEAGPDSDRAYLERNIIGLLVGKDGAADPSSPHWLGRFSPNERIRNSGLWNLDHLDYSYSREFLDVLDDYVMITIGKKPRPSRSLAPRGWYERERQKVSAKQLSLFQE